MSHVNAASSTITTEDLQKAAVLVERDALLEISDRLDAMIEEAQDLPDKK